MVTVGFTAESERIPVDGPLAAALERYRAEWADSTLIQREEFLAAVAIAGGAGDDLAAFIANVHSEDESLMVMVSWAAAETVRRQST